MLLMSPEGADPAVYELSYSTVTKSFRYRMRYGTGLSRYYNVTVVPPPSVTQMVITNQYPAYTKLLDEILPDGERDIVGVVGGKVKIQANFNRASEALLLLGEEELQGTPSSDTHGMNWTVELKAEMPDRWGLSLRDEHGFSNVVEWASFTVEADAAPTITLQKPRAETLTLPPYGHVDLLALIKEDFGLSTTNLVIDPQIFNGTLQIRPLEVTRGQEESWSAATVLEMGLLDLGGSRKFKFWVSVSDTRPDELGGAQEAISHKVEIKIEEAAARIEDQLRKEQKLDMMASLREAAERLEKAANEVAAVQDRTAVELLPPPIVKALTTAQDHSTAAMKLMHDAGVMAGSAAFAALSRPILWTNRMFVVPAHAEIAAISQIEPAKRRQQAATAVTSLRTAAAKILELMKHLEAMDKELDEIAKIEILADRERLLAKKAEHKDMTKEERDAWKEEQDMVMKDLQAQDQSKDKDLAEAKKQMEVAQMAMLTEEKEQAERQRKAEQEKANPENTESPKDPDAKQEPEGPQGPEEKGKEDDKKGKGSDPKDGKAKDGKAKDNASKKAKAKAAKGKGKGQGKKGKAGKGKDSKGKDSKGKGKKGKGGKGKGNPEPEPPSKAVPPTRKAAKLLKKVADELAEKMEEEMLAAMPPSMRPPKSGDEIAKGGNTRGKGAPVDFKPESFQAGAPDADWARIKGKANSGAMTDELQNIPPEYRDLVRQYFTELANEAANNSELPK
jgi:hypothetical protein